MYSKAVMPEGWHLTGVSVQVTSPRSLVGIFGNKEIPACSCHIYTADI